MITTATAGQRGGEDTIESVDLTGNQSLIDAAAQAGVRQFIFVSTIASDPNSPVPTQRSNVGCNPTVGWIRLSTRTACHQQYGSILFGVRFYCNAA